MVPGSASPGFAGRLRHPSGQRVGGVIRLVGIVVEAVLVESTAGHVPLSGIPAPPPDRRTAGSFDPIAGQLADRVAACHREEQTADQRGDRHHRRPDEEGRPAFLLEIAPLPIHRIGIASAPRIRWGGSDTATPAGSAMAGSGSGSALPGHFSSVMDPPWRRTWESTGKACRPPLNRVASAEARVLQSETCSTRTASPWGISRGRSGRCRLRHPTGTRHGLRVRDPTRSTLVGYTPRAITTPGTRRSDTDPRDLAELQKRLTCRSGKGVRLHGPVGRPRTGGPSGPTIDVAGRADRRQYRSHRCCRR